MRPIRGAWRHRRARRAAARLRARRRPQASTPGPPRTDRIFLDGPLVPVAVGALLLMLGVQLVQLRGALVALLGGLVRLSLALVHALKAVRLRLLSLFGRDRRAL